MVAPRYAWVPPRVRSLGGDCAGFWRSAGGSLFSWQESVLDGWLGLDENDRWASSNDGLDVARQNGKGVVLQALEVFFAFELGFDLVMHTAHEFATSQDHQLRLEEFIQNAPHLHSKVRGKGGYRHANGQESINLRSGCRIIFKARTKGGGRGYSADLLVWDEAMVIPDAVMGAQKPMLRASRAPHGSKTVYAGSAVDQEIHEYGVNFARIRERGIAKAANVSWFEWSAPLDHPAELTGAGIEDRAFWRAANPSMEDGLISEESMADEIVSMPTRTAAVELYGVGDWPKTDGSAAMVIAPEEWLRLADAGSEIEGPVCFAFDVAPDRSMAAIAAAGLRGDGLVHVEIVDRRKGTSWLPDRLAGLVERHEVEAVVCDAVGPGSSVLQLLGDLETPVEALNAREHANAFGLFCDLVGEQGLRHLGTQELEVALRGATRRPLGDAWAWSRKNSAIDISPLVAATLASYVAATRLEEGSGTDFVVDTRVVAA